MNRLRLTGILSITIGVLLLIAGLAAMTYVGSYEHIDPQSPEIHAMYPYQQLGVCLFLSAVTLLFYWTTLWRKGRAKRTKFGLFSENI